MIQCVKATKIADSLLKDENGNIVITHPETFYDRGLIGYWMLKKIGYNWKILRVVVS